MGEQGWGVNIPCYLVWTSSESSEAPGGSGKVLKFLSRRVTWLDLGCVKYSSCTLENESEMDTAEGREPNWGGYLV